MGNEPSSPVDQGRREGSPPRRSGSSPGWQHDDAQSSFSQYARHYPVQYPYNVAPDDPTQSRPPSGWQQQAYDQPSYSQPAQNYPVQNPYPPGYPYPPDYPQYPAHAAGKPSSESKMSTPYDAPPPRVHAPKKKIERRYSRIADNYSSLEEVTEALARAGLESSNLIIGIDFTKSNEWTGKHSNNGRSLHHLGPDLNPYEQAISIIGKTMAAFDEDNLIPCFGFGDASTHDQDVFSFYPDMRFCNGFQDVLMQYRKLVPNLKLAGPTSFAPIIEMAMSVVQQSGGQYHVLLILADGQVTRSVDTENGRLSPPEQKTVQAIVEASKLPLSIVLVGVGDGPWDTMKEFDDNIPAREFDNFQFVNFTGIMYKNASQARKETEFALAALMEIPSQYKATIELNLLGQRNHKVPQRTALPPPRHGGASAGTPGHTAPFASGRYYEQKLPPEAAAPSAPSAPTPAYEQQTCPICFVNPKDMAFGCGHLACRECGGGLELCPICRRRIETRIRLY